MQINYNETTLVDVRLNPKNNTHRFPFKLGLPSPDDVFRVISTPAPACHSREPRSQMRIYISIFPAHYSAVLPVFFMLISSAPPPAFPHVNNSGTRRYAERHLRPAPTTAARLY